MQALDKLVTTVAKSKLSVLVLGETGVGKDVVVSRIHERSPRASEPFVALNCAALPESILDGELFGHEKGAFTGATEAKPGLFESANRGTVFLDEIGEMPIGTQAKLLRTLENGEVLRLGARKPTKIDVRVLAATHRDLEAMIEAGSFRQDLFYRLNGVSIALSPLRKRPTEILPFAEMFLRDAHPSQQFTEDAKAALRAHAWPGNIRELRNVVERASVLTESDRIDAEALGLARSAKTAPSAPRDRDDGPNQDPMGATDRPSLPDELRALERARICEALEAARGNQTKAAEALGMSRFALRKRIEDFGIEQGKKKS